MWYEILPTIGIIYVAVAGPYFLSPLVHRLLIGRTYRRDNRTYSNRMMYLRDERLTGVFYKPIGLEGIPDEDEASSETSN